MKVREIYNVEPCEGTFGVEVEVEGDKLPERVQGFHRERDGSLRGESAEYVFKGPVDKVRAFKRVDSLFKAYEDCGTELFNSYRCSIHVHLNVQEWTMTEIANMFVLYAIFEEYLVKFCGEHREGNLFCLRIRDAEYIVDQFTKMLLSCNAWIIDNDIRYAAINFNALPKFGSLEFRSMRGADTAEDLKRWLNLLDCLYQAAPKYNNPTEILSDISRLGAKGLAEQVFGESMKFLPLSDDWEEVVFHNMRLVQEVAFLPDWEVVGKWREGAAAARQIKYRKQAKQFAAIRDADFQVEDLHDILHEERQDGGDWDEEE